MGSSAEARDGKDASRFWAVRRLRTVSQSHSLTGLRTDVSGADPPFHRGGLARPQGRIGAKYGRVDPIGETRDRRRNRPRAFVAE
jgi:hypothetical protein